MQAKSEIFDASSDAGEKPRERKTKNGSSLSNVDTQFIPPDGGWGWVCVFASFMISFIGDGVTHSFGILFVEFIQYFGASKSATAWTASLFFSVPLLTGPIASYFTDRWGCRFVTIVGALISSLSLAAGYLASELHYLTIAFSISGLGLSLCYVTSVVIVAYYFDKKRSLANGLATCGAGIGTIVFPPLTIALVEYYSWRGTLLIFAGAFLNAAVFGALMRDLNYPDSLSEEESSVNRLSLVLEEDEEESSLSTSMLQLPTYILNENLNSEVIQELSTKEGGHLSTLLEQYPDILNSYLCAIGEEPARQFTESAKRNKINVVHYRRNANFQNCNNQSKPQAHQCPLMPDLYICTHNPSYLRHIRIRPGNMTYRGAMLNLPRYHLRTSSCPDVYKNALTEQEKGAMNCQFLSGLKELIFNMVDLRIFKNLSYSTFCLSNFLLYACLDIPYLYIPDYALHIGINIDSSSLLISILGILNTIGMVFFGYIGDRPAINSTLVYSITMCISGAAVGLLPFIRQYSSMALVVATYGFAISTNYALTAGLLVELITLDNFANAYGLLLLVQGISTLVGPPFAGWLYDINGSYDIPFFVAGICTFLSGIVIFPLCGKRNCRTLKVFLVPEK